MVSAEQNALNIRSAENVAAVALGVDKNNLTYDERVAFLGKVAELILANPERFNSRTLATAQATKDKRYAPLSDPTFDFEQFASEVAENGVQTLGAVAEVGNGVTSTLKMAGWLIPVAAFVAVGVLLYSLFLRVKPARRSRA